MNEMSFMEAVHQGEASLEDVDDWIDDWHCSARGRNMDLHDFLGLTVEQFHDFVTDPDILRMILREMD